MRVRELEYTQENYCALYLSILTGSTPEQSFLKLQRAGRYERLTPDESTKEKIIELYNGGFGLDEIVAKTHTSITWVKQTVMEKYGVWKKLKYKKR